MLHGSICGHRCGTNMVFCGRRMHEKIPKYLVIREGKIFNILTHGEREHLRENLRKLALYTAGLAR